MLLDIPTSIVTERLVLTVPGVNDVPMLNRAIRSSFPELHPWIPWAKRCPKPVETKAHCLKAARAFKRREEFALLVRLRQNRAIIGGAGLVRGDWSVPKFEIGYWVQTDFTGNGYVTEAVEALVRFARRHLRVRRLEIRTDSRNARSAAVARRAGFQLEAVLHQDARDNRGRLRDTQVFAKLF